MNTVKTPKGTVLPLVSLKGKDYLMVAHRILWFNEEVETFGVETNFLVLTDEQTVARATVTIFDKDGKMLKRSTATKRETKSDFSDHTEKAETSAIGRAVALLGYGTQFAIADLEEGTRLADSPMTNPKARATVVEPKVESRVELKAETKDEVKKSTSSFRKSNGSNGSSVKETISTPADTSKVDGWE